MKWYLIWFFLVQGSNGDVNRTYTESKLMTSQLECIFEAEQKEIKMEETLNKPHVLVAGHRAYQYGLVVGYKVGCRGVK